MQNLILQKYHADMELKYVDKDEDMSLFKASLSVMENVDRDGDMIQKGAFDSWLSKGVSRIPMLWQHDKKMPMGYFENSKVEGNLLTADGVLLKKTTVGRDADILLQNEAIKGVSIGYISKRWGLRRNKDMEDYDAIHTPAYGRDLKEIELFEASIVTVPSNDQAMVLKSLSDTEANQLILEYYTQNL